MLYQYEKIGDVIVQAMICELCGSNDIVKQEGVFVCQHCGTKYSVEDAKKLIGVVSIDRTSETEKLLILARRAKDENNEENAAKYYDMVLQNNPLSWEASFYQVYFQSMSCKIYQIANAAYAVANCLNGVLSLIHEHEQEDKQESALEEVILRSSMIANMLANAAISHYSEHSSVDGALDECRGRVVAASTIYNQLEDSIKKENGNKHNCLLVAQKAYLEFVSTHAGCFKGNYRDDLIIRLTSEIRQSDSSYTPPKVKTGGCYIATCVYGSYDCPSVWMLRRYRDNVLAENLFGRAFIRIYYAISPNLVKRFGDTAWFRMLWKRSLDRIVANLREKGFSDTPYDDKDF